MYNCRWQNSPPYAKHFKKRLRNNEIDDSLFRVNTVYYRPGCTSSKHPSFARNRPDCTNLLIYISNGKPYHVVSPAPMAHFHSLLSFLISRPINKPDRYDNSLIRSLPIQLVCWIITSALLAECDRPFDTLPSDSEIDMVMSKEGRNAILKYAAVVVNNSKSINGMKCILTRVCIVEFLYMITRKHPLTRTLNDEFKRFLSTVPKTRLITMTSSHVIKCTPCRFPSEMSTHAVDANQQVIGVVARIRKTKMHDIKPHQLPRTLTDFNQLGFTNDFAISVFTSWLHGLTPSLRHPSKTPFRTTQTEDRFFRVLHHHTVMQPYCICWTTPSDVVYFGFCRCCGNMSKTETFCESKCFRGTSNPSRCHTPDEPVVQLAGFTISDYSYDTLQCVKCKSTQSISLFNIFKSVLYIPLHNIYITACSTCHRAMRLNRILTNGTSFGEFHYHSVCPECNTISTGLPCVYSHLNLSRRPQKLVPVVSYLNGQVPICKKHKFFHADDTAEFEPIVHNQATCY